MKRFFILSEPLFEDWKSISVGSEYDKKRGGYIIRVCPEKEYEVCGMVAYERSFSIGYYNSIGDLNVLVAPCGRRSAKKEEIANKEVEEDAERYVQKFLELNKKEDLKFQEYSV